MVHLDLHQNHLQHPWPCDSCPKLTTDRNFFWRVKQSVLQFVFIKPITALLALFLNHYGVYQEGSFSPKGPYLYLSIVNNLSITVPNSLSIP